MSRGAEPTEQEAPVAPSETPEPAEAPSEKVSVRLIRGARGLGKAGDELEVDAERAGELVESFVAVRA